MVGEFFVLLFVSLELFFLPPAQSAIDFFLTILSLQLVPSLKHANIGVVFDDLTIDWVGVTPAERQVVNGIQQIGFTHAVISHKTVYFGR
ncbi:hypothetical protein SDC9_93170 [bioreactor metagenome]|uniref:Uncharacterized protein n=1 Tax=bioreactor metagenome TaxID=1076179 RepID=A0A644ZZS1_9ZZZZ